jgi:hypothetical protein
MVELVTTTGIFSLDGGDFEVENNIWIVGDDRHVVVIDAAHDHRPIIEAVGDRTALSSMVEWAAFSAGGITLRVIHTPGHTGGGVVGMSITDHLTTLGWRDIVLLERDTLTSGTTWHEAALIASADMVGETSHFIDDNRTAVFG